MHFSSEELDILSRHKPSTAHRWLAPSGRVGVFAVIDHGATPALGELRMGRSTDQAQTLDEACLLARSASIRAGLLGLPNGGMATVAVADPDLDEATHAALLCERVGDAEVRAHAGDGLEESEHALGENVHRDAEALAQLRGDVLESCLRPLVALRGCTAVVLDCGPAGRDAATRLRDQGARVRLWDHDFDRAGAIAQSLGVEPLGEPWEEADVDLLVPCGPSPILDEASAQRLVARFVCGPSARVFADATARETLENRGTRFVPEILAATAELIAVAIAEGWLERAAVLQLIGKTAQEVLAEPRSAQARATTLAVQRSKAAAGRGA